MARPKKTQTSALFGDFAAEFSEAGVGVPGPTTAPRILQTGIDTIDVATGVGGLPEGRWYVVQGEQSSGKTTLCGIFAAEVLRKGGVVLYMDHERKLSQDYFERLGVEYSTGRFLIAHPKYIEQAFAMIVKAGETVRKTNPDVPILVIWDSTHSIPCYRTFTKEFEESDFPVEAGAYDRCFKKATAAVADLRVTTVFISQQRIEMTGFKPKAKIGIGKAIGHAASMVFQFSPPEPIKEGTERVGSLCKVTVIKNQVANPWAVARFPISETGLDRPATTFLAGKAVGLVTKTGHFSATIPAGLLKLHGLPSFRNCFEQSPEVFEQLRDCIRAESAKAARPRLGPDDQGDEPEVVEEAAE